MILPLNTHICHFYRTKQELLEVLIPFFADGLARQEFCLWGVTAPLNVTEAKTALGEAVDNIEAALTSGQLEIFDIGLLYGAAEFDAKAVRDAFLEKVKTSLAKGWKGFRCDGITSGVKPKDWKNLQIYEQEVTRTLKPSVTALCSYNLNDLTRAQLAEAAETHSAAMVKKKNDWSIVDSSDLSHQKKDAA